MEKNEKEIVRIFALGGLDEDGKNMMCVQVDEDIYIIEAGLKFPEAGSAFGVEHIIPDFSWLEKHADQVKGIIITHGHDDVMGALPYLLKVVKADIYTSPFTARVISKKLKDHRITGVKIKKVNRGDTKKIGGRSVVFFPLTHSYPQAFGVGIRTQNGYIVYSGEFIEDYDNLGEIYKGDYQVINRFKNDGVLILMQDSKSADRPGHTSPHHRIGKKFENVLNQYEKKRIFVEVYTQSVYRIQEIISACIKHNRKMCFYTKQMQELIAGIESITEVVPPELVISAQEANSVEDAVIIISGQGKNLFKLMSNIANNEVPDLRFEQDDVIVVATPLIPGVEKTYKDMENDIYKREGIIIKIDKDVLGMHPSKEDLKMMLFLTDPKYYIPIKGEYRMLCANAMVAEEMGMPVENILILDNGQVATFEDGNLKTTQEVMNLRDQLIDGKENWDMSGVVLKDREILSTDGVMILAVGLDAKNKKVINGPDVQMRGLVYLRDADYITKDVSKIMEDVIADMVEKKQYDNMECRSIIRDKVAKYLFKSIAKRPMVLPVILEINNSKNDNPKEESPKKINKATQKKASDKKKEVKTSTEKNVKRVKATAPKGEKAVNKPVRKEKARPVRRKVAAKVQSGSQKEDHPSE